MRASGLSYHQPCRSKGVKLDSSRGEGREVDGLSAKKYDLFSMALFGIFYNRIPRMCVSTLSNLDPDKFFLAPASFTKLVYTARSQRCKTKHAFNDQHISL